MFSQPSCLLILLSTILHCLICPTTIFAFQTPVDENEPTSHSNKMSMRNSPMDTDNGEGPTRKKSRLEESSGQFPDTLEGFGYHFNQKGELRHITTGERYVFEAEKGNNAYNQERYGALGKIVTKYTYKLLETETNLKRVYIPKETAEGEPRSFVFVSEKALTTTDKLLVLINGSGVVRAGQWARRLIINDCLDSGTQIPYIKRAMEAGYEVLVLNTNENKGLNARGETVPIRESESPYEHAVYAWDNFVAKQPVKRVAIVAHSMGGIITAHIAEKREQSFLKKVFAMAFTDSVHNLGISGVSRSVRKLFAKHSINWISSSKPLDTPIPLTHSAGLDSTQVSAGTKVHAETSWTSIESIFSYLKEKEVEAVVGGGQARDKPASLALDEDYDDDDDSEDDADDGGVNDKDNGDGEKVLEARGSEDGEGGGEGDGDDSQRQESTAGSVNTAGDAGIDISPSEEGTEASFDFTRYSEEL